LLEKAEEGAAPSYACIGNIQRSRLRMASHQNLKGNLAGWNSWASGFVLRVRIFGYQDIGLWLSEYQDIRKNK